MAKVENPAKPLARVDFLHRADRQYEIVVCMMPDPSVLVGQKDARAVVALDASRSMRNVVTQQADGLPGKFTFILPAGCSSFALRAGGQEIVQDLSSAMG